MNVNFYTSLGTAESDMVTQMGTFTDKFAPIKDESVVLKIMLDCIGLAFSLAASPMWNSGKHIASPSYTSQITNTLTSYL
jgi:hypothetical protein